MKHFLNRGELWISFDRLTWWLVVVNLLGIGAAIGMIVERAQ